MGSRLGIELCGALTTQSALITLAGWQYDGSALATIDFAADGDRAILEWTRDDFQVVLVDTATEA